MSTHTKAIAAAAAVLLVAVAGCQSVPGNGGEASRRSPHRRARRCSQPRRHARHRRPRQLRQLPPHLRAPCSRRGTRARGMDPGSSRRAARRPSRSCPASRSRFRRAGSTAATSTASRAVPGHARQPGRVRCLRGPRPRDPHGAAKQPVFRLRCVGGQSWDGDRDRRRHGGQRRPCDVRAGRRHDRWPAGQQIDVQLDPGWTESCPGDPPGFDFGDMRTRVILLDTPDRGVIVIFLGSLHSADHEAFLAEAMPIIESFQFDLNP